MRLVYGQRLNDRTQPRAAAAVQGQPSMVGSTAEAVRLAALYVSPAAARLAAARQCMRALPVALPRPSGPAQLTVPLLPPPACARSGARGDERARRPSGRAAGGAQARGGRPAAQPAAPPEGGELGSVRAQGVGWATTACMALVPWLACDACLHLLVAGCCVLPTACAARAAARRACCPAGAPPASPPCRTEACWPACPAALRSWKHRWRCPCSRSACTKSSSRLSARCSARCWPSAGGRGCWWRQRPSRPRSRCRGAARPRTTRSVRWRRQRARRSGARHGCAPARSSRIALPRATLFARARVHLPRAAARAPTRPRPHAPLTLARAPPHPAPRCPGPAGGGREGLQAGRLDGRDRGECAAAAPRHPDAR